MNKLDRPRSASEVANGLGISVSTLNAWLGDDSLRPLAERRFTFHNYRGRKRVWTEEAVRQLQESIERESGYGGVLGRWRSQHGPSHSSNARAEAALRNVLAYSPHTNRDTSAADVRALNDGGTL